MFTTIISEAIITTGAVISLLLVTAILLTTGYYLAAPLGYLAPRSIGLAMGQDRPLKLKETRVVGSIFVALASFIELLFKVVKPEFKEKASGVWDWSPLMWFVWSVYLEIGLKAVIITGLLSAVVMGIRWTGLMNKI
ncbi:hypothetical protein KCU64_g14899, partial [Aureobasidium melanogenum]